MIRLGGDDFEGDFFVGDALDINVLLRSGIENADAFIASTNNDNLNIVIAQIAKQRFHVKNVVVRLFDPDKAKFYKTKGLTVICPTIRAIDDMIATVDSVVVEA